MWYPSQFLFGTKVIGLVLYKGGNPLWDARAFDGFRRPLTNKSYTIKICIIEIRTTLVPVSAGNKTLICLFGRYGEKVFVIRTVDY